MKLLITSGVLLMATTVFAEKRPDWINEPAKHCRSSEICVVGEGPGRMGAERAAKAAISSVFQTHVKATFSSLTSGDDSQSFTVKKLRHTQNLHLHDIS